MPRTWLRPWPRSKLPLPETVAIIGAGPLGRWLALKASRAGFRVLLEDVMPQNLHHAQEWLRRELGPKQLGEQGRSWGDMPEEQASGAKAPVDSSATISGLKAGPTARESSSVPVEFVSTIEDAVREADLAIDCVPDELESKLEIFCLLDRMAPPRTVLATPSTRLSIADLASCTYRPDRCVAVVAEAASLASGESTEILLRTTRRTSAETVELLDRFWRRLGLVPSFETDPVETDGGDFPISEPRR